MMAGDVRVIAKDEDVAGPGVRLADPVGVAGEAREERVEAPVERPIPAGRRRDDQRPARRLGEDAADQAEAVAPDPADRGALDEGRPDPAARQRGEVGAHDREPPSLDPPSTG